jgi:protease I
MKKALFIIAPVNFRDEEFLEPKAMLEKAGVKVTVASSKTGSAKGKFGATARVDILLTNASVSDYDAIVFIGGSGASVYLDDPVAHHLAQEAFNQRKLLAAICIAPAILARAGVLKGKKATVFETDASELSAGGAQYTGALIEKDGLIITGSGPQAASQFGGALAEYFDKAT